MIELQAESTLNKKQNYQNKHIQCFHFLRKDCVSVLVYFASKIYRLSALQIDGLEGSQTNFIA